MLSSMCGKNGVPCKISAGPPHLKIALDKFHHMVSNDIIDMGAEFSIRVLYGSWQSAFVTLRSRFSHAMDLFAGRFDML